MKAPEFEAVWRQSPFRPFAVHADNRTIIVEHPEQVYVTPDRDTVVVVPREGGMQILAMDHISALSMKPRVRRSRPIEPA